MPLNDPHRFQHDEDIYQLLHDYEIKYQVYQHKAVFTVAQSKDVVVPGTGIKNLYLLNQKKEGHLVVMTQDKRLNIKQLAQVMDSSRFSFASPHCVKKDCGVQPGSVNPFCALNGLFRTVVDRDLHDCLIAAHPMRNDRTLVMQARDLWGLLSRHGVQLIWQSL